MSLLSKIGLKGHSAPSPGHRPGLLLYDLISPCKGKSSIVCFGFCPFRANVTAVLLPRALPWAMCCWPFRPCLSSGRNLPLCSIIFIYLLSQLSFVFYYFFSLLSHLTFVFYYFYFAFISLILCVILFLYHFYQMSA